MQLPVMASAEGNREFIAHFQANAARLRKSKMMRVARLSSTDKTGLQCDKLEMRLVTKRPLRRRPQAQWKNRGAIAKRQSPLDAKQSQFLLLRSSGS
jgi:hypothetical protein